MRNENHFKVLTWKVPGRHPRLRVEQADVELLRYAQSHRLLTHRVCGSTCWHCVSIRQGIPRDDGPRSIFVGSVRVRYLSGNQSRAIDLILG